MTLPIDFDVHPLIPTVIQDDATRDVLMIGFMNRLAFEKTMETGFVHFWSRSRNQLWKKGETSGHTQEVISMAVNCEDNSLLIEVIQHGAVCHTGHMTCFYRQVLPDGSLFETSDPVFDPAEVYQVQHSTEAALANSSRPQQDDTGFIASWFGAYEYLARHPLQDVSTTSRLLHEKTQPFDRIADEMDELAGVLAGEHSHSGSLVQDVILEGSQVLYWLNLLAIGTGKSWDRDLQLDNVFLAPQPVDERTESIVAGLRAAATDWRQADGRFREDTLREQLIGELSSGYWLVSRAVSPIVAPSSLVKHDLEELRAKPYLTDYFSAAAG